MKRYVVTVILLCSSVIVANAQSRGGNTRDSDYRNSGERNPNGRPGISQPIQSPSPQPQPSPPPPPSSRPVVEYPSPPPHPLPPPPSPCPTIIEVVPTPPTIIVANNPIVRKEKPEVNEVVLRDSGVAPEKSGFDFSAEEVVHENDKAVDVFFSVSQQGPEFVVGNDADIQDLGQDVSFSRLDNVSSSEWSPTRRVHGEVGNVYVLWTWDNQYYKFRATSLASSRVAIEWVKMDCGARIAANDDYRNGRHHRDQGEKFVR